MLLHINGGIWIIQTSGLGITYQTFWKLGKISKEPDPSLTLKNKLQIKIMCGKMKYKNREESMGKYVSGTLMAGAVQGEFKVRNHKEKDLSTIQIVVKDK